MSSQARLTVPAAAIEAYPFAEQPAPSNCAEWDFPIVDEKGCVIVRAGADATDPSPREDFALRLQEEARRSFEAGRQRGWEDGRTAERAAHIPAEQYWAEQLGRLFDDFAAERDRYLRDVEQEVVRLALAVAARILRRESQMDPLLLLGAVRVALGQLASGSEVRLHVPPADAELWKEAVALVPHPPVRPVVVADDGLHLGDCHLETSLGHVDLGVGAQLGEIERSFLDRAAVSGNSRRAAERSVEVESAS